MKDFLRKLGSAFLIMIVGFCPIIIGVIFMAVSESGKYDNVIMTLSILAGAFLGLFVMKRQYGIDIKNYIQIPKAKTSLTVATTALAYEASAMLTVYKPVLLEEAAGGETASAIDWLSAVVFAPPAEELIFRFGMLLLLLGEGENPSLLRKIAAVLTTSAIWSVTHLSGDLPRIIDIIMIGTLMGCIFLKYKNIFYSIFFHAAANFAAGLPAEFILKYNFILYISIPLCVLGTVLLFAQKEAGGGSREAGE